MKFLQSYAHTGGRILLSLIFLSAGLIKLQDPAAFVAVLEGVGLPGMAAYAVIAVEIIGGGMILIGYQTRNAAITLGCLYLAGMVLLNLRIGSQDEIMQFVQKIGLAGGFLILFAQGAGRMSMDALAEPAPRRPAPPKPPKPAKPAVA